MIFSLESVAGAFVAVVGVGRKGATGRGDERPEGMLVRQATSVLRCFAAAGASRVGLAHLRAPSILERSPGVRLPAGAVCFFDRSRAAAKRFC